jgi:hypothetical protein
MVIANAVKSRASSNALIADTPSRSERVKVFCRVRPLLQRERDGWSYDEYAQQQFGDEDASEPNLKSIDATTPQEAASTPVFLTDKAKVSLDASVLSIHENGKSLVLNGHSPDSDRKEFAFDASLPEASAQEDVYQSAAYDIVQDVLEGYNGTILAYGQTSTGKTYTMLGKENDLYGDHRGIVPRAFEDIFAVR